MKFRITSRFGEIDDMHKTPHTGIDIALPENTPLKSVVNGVVDRVVDYGDKNIGKGVVIRFNGGDEIIYGHMNKIFVKEGERVWEGEVIGLSGNTGRSSGPHLHLGVKDDGKFIDGTAYVNKLERLSEGKQEFIGESLVSEYMSDSTQETIKSTLNGLMKLSEKLSEMNVNVILFLKEMVVFLINWWV